VGVPNGECGEVGIEQNATFEFTVTAEECFDELKEVVSIISLVISVFQRLQGRIFFPILILRIRIGMMFGIFGLYPIPKLNRFNVHSVIN
jgi:NhaP-type Na+/H+ and K+/H+ antiporter